MRSNRGLRFLGLFRDLQILSLRLIFNGAMALKLVKLKWTTNVQEEGKQQMKLSYWLLEIEISILTSIRRTRTLAIHSTCMQSMAGKDVVSSGSGRRLVLDPSEMEGRDWPIRSHGRVHRQRQREPDWGLKRCRY